VEADLIGIYLDESGRHFVSREDFETRSEFNEWIYEAGWEWGEKAEPSTGDDTRVVIRGRCARCCKLRHPCLRNSSSRQVKCLTCRSDSCSHGETGNRAEVRGLATGLADHQDASVRRLCELVSRLLDSL
jgi:hypothetical protein